MNRSRSMITLFAGAAILLPAGLVAAGCGSGASTPAHAAPPKKASAPPAVVSAERNGKLGRILVDSQGRTLYIFTRDSGTTSACAGACAAAWPPLRSSGKPVVRGGAIANLVGTIARRDGKRQAKYNGHPLYRFVMDAKPGDTNGEGLMAFGGTWLAISPAGNPVRPPAPPAPKPQPKPQPQPQPQPNPIPQNNGGDHDSDNNGGPDDGDGGV